jgi:hypothetical protein
MRFSSAQKRVVYQVAEKVFPNLQGLKPLKKRGHCSGGLQSRLAGPHPYFAAEQFAEKVLWSSF